MLCPACPAMSTQLPTQEELEERRNFCFVPFSFTFPLAFRCFLITDLSICVGVLPGVDGEDPVAGGEEARALPHLPQAEEQAPPAGGGVVALQTTVSA